MDAARPSLLGHLHGERPPAPAWFAGALACRPERSLVPVRGARIELLTWGERGRPGLLLCHGNAANADLWRFVAPYFAEEFRVAALSWSGMGGSDWRRDYGVAGFADEAAAACEAAGLFESGVPPVLVGHSAGGGPVLHAAHHWGDRLAGVVAVDTLIRPIEEQPRPASPRPHRIYATRAEALARYKLVPAQPCANLFIVHLLACASIKQVDGGWTWRFDPALWQNFRAGPVWPLLGRMRCPVALMYGEKSSLTAEPVLPRILSQMAESTIRVIVPEAHHHVMIDQPIAFVASLRALVEHLIRPYRVREAARSPGVR